MPSLCVTFSGGASCRSGQKSPAPARNRCYASHAPYMTVDGSIAPSNNMKTGDNDARGTRLQFRRCCSSTEWFVGYSEMQAMLCCRSKALTTQPQLLEAHCVRVAVPHAFQCLAQVYPPKLTCWSPYCSST